MNPFLSVFGSGAKRDGSVPEMNIRSDLGRPASLKIEGTGSSPTVVVSSPSYHLLPRAPGHAFFLHGTGSAGT